MARTKIAPVLQELCAAEWNGLGVKRFAGLFGSDYHKAEGEAWEEATRELRALLAVARAAEGVRAYIRDPKHKAVSCPADDALFRALARLARASRPKAPTTGDDR